MFDIGWSEMVFVVIVAILVIGPKDLPRAIASVGKYVRKARALARDFQSGIDDLARDAELDDLKKTVQNGTDFNIKKQIEDAVDPTGTFENMFDDVKPEIRDPRKSGTADAKPAAGAADTSAKTDTSTTSDNSISPPPAEDAKPAPAVEGTKAS
ncbi:Sec-independent protein translocase protein TatB [Sneathiella chinensis]|uniref:Sec-independent protein translocase protein TatB n=1 Tax=Sneathiella chinensis TaxID=349750 RepID=A0ABQ5U5N4_9PROT|nr:Sec-independent protein translocase protein TatB [Sneathiella chinensis]GLQ07472.1 hypothetical protein GCM10007924_26930 [Sneathiella chinensis]